MKGNSRDRFKGDSVTGTFNATTKTFTATV